MTDHWAQPPPPPTKLGRYRKLAPLAGVHLSPISLGAMSIGDKWGSFMGSMDKEQSFKLLDAYYNAGGNFIDTANNYQDETSERFIGEWMEKRGNRNQVFVATKYTTNYKTGEGPEFGPKTFYTGNSIKAMHISVDESLKKLRTDYIDLLYVHWWDYETGIEEVMNGLHNLVTQGKVLYLGISDTPAWVVSAANTYARLTGKTPFVIYQGAWSVMHRDFEREILPMARQQGMALAPWNVLAGGKIRTDEEEERRRQTGEGGRTMGNPAWERNEDEKKVCKALEKVAKEVGAKHITAVAIAYVMQKSPYVFPIVGGRKVEHLMSNLEALDIDLSPEHIAYIESVLPFQRGFPYDFFSSDDGDFNHLFKSAGHFDKWPAPQAIRPAK
ncbi:Aldo/keto reductase [Cristinia sonorae]|uniref:Aldo/keto reductase n=1 Tax=Cristinia sonorae TaxID=1940300 RepID=A0A8K0UY06_9AGAR|nr:Aldo/keto reductase [Cristinia sonorae]